MSMIEVLVAVLVLSVGLLGMGTLLAVSLRNTQSASYRTQAANIAYEYVDIVRSYVARGSNSKVGLVAQNAYTTPTCDPATPPSYTCNSQSNALACDIQRIADRVCRALPNGRIRGRVTTIGAAPSRRLAVEVDVCWLDDRSQTVTSSAGCTSNSEAVFSMTTEL